MHLTLNQARRLLLCRAGLLKPELTGLPAKARPKGKAARAACHKVIRRFGYLQLDTVSVAGARSQALVLLSRLEGLQAETAEELLRPGEPLFEYWGHEASWIPTELYPAFAWRRRRYRVDPWWGDIVGKNKHIARDLKKRIRDEGPLKSADLEGQGGAGWWNLKLAKRVAIALWRSGDLAIRERRRFQRSYDLPERVIPETVRARKAPPEGKAVEQLLLRALTGHGVAATSTLFQTWRFNKMRTVVDAALARLERAGSIQACTWDTVEGKKRRGWMLPEDEELVDKLTRARPNPDKQVLLSPFDPVLWDRKRVWDLFGFHQRLEIFTPEPEREFGYFCLPVLAGDKLIGRVDLKADRKAGRLRVAASHAEAGGKLDARPALERYASAVTLTL